MAFSLVGSRGAASVGASGAAVTPAWGTSENRTAGNLLVCTVSVFNSSQQPATPAGWSKASVAAPTSAVSVVFIKRAAGTDAAPTISGIASARIAAQLSEYSSTNPWALDRAGLSTGTTSPRSSSGGSPDRTSGALMIAASADLRSSAGTTSDTWTSNNGTPTLAGSNNAASSTDHYSFAALVATTSNAAATTAVMTASVTTNVTQMAVCMVTFTEITTNTYAQVRADGPVAYFRLSEPSGTTVVDDIGGIHNGIYKNAPTLGVTGALAGDSNKAITLNGTNQYIEVPDHADFSYTDETLTWECWAKHTGTFGSFWDSLIGKGAGNIPFWAIVGPSTGTQGTMNFRNGSLSVNIARSTVAVLTDTNWHHYAVTYDGSICRMYFDGLEVPTTTDGNSTFDDTANPHGIGSSWGSTWSDGFHGSMDEVAIYNKALAPRDIAAHYAGRAVTPPTQSITLGRISQTAATFAPAITQGPAPAQNLTIALLTQAAATFTPTVFQQRFYTPVLINQTAATFAPSVTQVGPTQNLTIALLNRTAVVSTPTVTTLNALSFARITQTAVASTPSVQPGPVGVSLGLISQPAAPFTPSLLLGMGVAVWTTPADGVPILAQPALTFLIPTAATGPMHFQMELDDNSGFSSPTVIDSSDDQTGWEYWTGSAWAAVPSGGVASSFGGNEARHTPVTPLASGTYYRRVRAGLVG